MIALDLAREMYSYDRHTGVLINHFTGHVLTGISIKFKNKTYEKSRFIWFLFYGGWPPKGYLVDHIDRNRRNNSIDNLRLATTQQNSYNQRKKSDFLKGVTFDASRTKSWRAQIRIDGKKVNLGRYDTEEEAATAYREAALKHHGEFACHD
jgi:HNH endonuclease/AP2 domain